MGASRGWGDSVVQPSCWLSAAPLRLGKPSHAIVVTGLLQRNSQLPQGTTLNHCVATEIRLRFTFDPLHPAKFVNLSGPALEVSP